MMDDLSEDLCNTAQNAQAQLHCFKTLGDNAKCNVRLEFSTNVDCSLANENQQVCEGAVATNDLTTDIDLDVDGKGTGDGLPLVDDSWYMPGVCKYVGGTCSAKTCVDFGNSNSNICPNGLQAPNGETCVWTG